MGGRVVWVGSMTEGGSKVYNERIFYLFCGVSDKCFGGLCEGIVCSC